MAQYGKQSYWEDRYRRYPGLRETFDAVLRKEEPVLMVGCGNSRLSEDMAEDGYNSISNIDISPTVIEAMRQRTKARSDALTWEVMDVCRMTYPAGRFGSVVDKGTLDALLCGDDSTANAHKMCEQVSRVLRSGGAFVVVSYGTPENRLCYLENDSYGWKVTHKAIAKPVISGDAPAAAAAAAGASNAPPSAAAAASSASSSAPQELHYVYICKKV